MDEMLRRTWAEVSLDAIAHNYRVIRGQLKPGTGMCCVVKADAYGHGAERLAREYAVLGADWFAVSNLEEAVQIRRAGVKQPILILGYTPPGMAATLAGLEIRQALLGAEYAKRLSEAAEKAGVTVRAHLKLDTGMGRIGFSCRNVGQAADSLDEAERACRLPGIDAEGVFTHFAVADEGEDGETFTRGQFAGFTNAVDALEKRGIRFKIRHCANSAAIFDYPEMHLDMVRPGIILYGLMPSERMRQKPPFQPAMELKSVVSLVKSIEPGETVSYGRVFRAERPTVVATVPVGYADGYPRRLYRDASMLVHGKRAKIIGRVCMDQLMLDVTDIPGVQEGDTVTVFGHDGGEFLSVDELAKYDGTINYEMVCGIAKRVPRIYFREGREAGTLDYLSR